MIKLKEMFNTVREIFEHDSQLMSLTEDPRNMIVRCDSGFFFDINNANNRTLVSSSASQEEIDEVKGEYGILINYDKSTVIIDYCKLTPGDSLSFSVVYQCLKHWPENIRRYYYYFYESDDFRNPLRFDNEDSVFSKFFVKAYNYMAIRNLSYEKHVRGLAT